MTLPQLVDMQAVYSRLQRVDPDATHFPAWYDAFYEHGFSFTVEGIINGRNLVDLAHKDVVNFRNSPKNLRVVAREVCKALALLERAQIVHNDVKPDNILWVPAPVDADGMPTGPPTCRLVDF